ncbi:beta-2-glycoprotein 1 isoform X2 [Dendropsophus ebraccatus]|uniref:beta-2-glycoprotein 1 isoform X2 n=1 Tax=Dendropsophus ebraccatus TaxID=150705 RepID=UPI00383157D7
MLQRLLLAAVLCLIGFSAAGKVCGRPRQVENAVFRPGRVVYNPQDVVTYSCNLGYVKDSGNDKALCLILGNWEHATLQCKRQQCPKPGALENGTVRYTDITYQSIIYFSCHEGYRLRGANESQCLVSGAWSAPFPVCEAVKCQRPTEIPNGYMSFAPYRKYDYKEAVTYGCNPPYTLVGSRTSYCDKDGEWTQKPLCQAPCHVPTPKANVLHNGRKTRVDEISRQQIQHGDVITYYCKNKIEKCAYTVESRCHDGNFTVPACYKKPGVFSVFTTDPSDMVPCPEASQQSAI